jgi:uncharacterized membrane protein
MRVRNLDLIGAASIAIASITLALLPYRPPFVEIVLAIPLVFVLPGYTLTQALFRPRHEDSSPNSASSHNGSPGGLILPPKLITGYDFGMVDQLAFSLGLSLAIDILAGIFLNLLPIGLQWRSWSLALGLLTLAFALLAWLRRLTSSSDLAEESRPRAAQAPPPPNRSTPAPTFSHFGKGQRRPYKEISLLIAALLVAGLAVWLAMVRPPQPQPSFTQFWMLPSAQASHSCAVQVGMQSFETAPVTYRIQVTGGGIQVFSSSSITLDKQQQWSRTVSIPNASGSEFVDARLYRLDQPGAVYREVHVTLHGC